MTDKKIENWAVLIIRNSGKDVEIKEIDGFSTSVFAQRALIEMVRAFDKIDNFKSISFIYQKSE